MMVRAELPIAEIVSAASMKSRYRTLTSSRSSSCLTSTSFAVFRSRCRASATVLFCSCSRIALRVTRSRAHSYTHRDVLSSARTRTREHCTQRANTKTLRLSSRPRSLFLPLPHSFPPARLPPASRLAFRVRLPVWLTHQGQGSVLVKFGEILSLFIKRIKEGPKVPWNAHSSRRVMWNPFKTRGPD
jgi:hypothetical protein